MNLRAVVGALVACVGISCGNDGVGTVAVSWRISSLTAASTCSDEGVSVVTLSAVDNTSRVVASVSAPCSDRAALLTEVPLGTHQIIVEMLGTFGEPAGGLETTATVTADDDEVVLPELELEALPQTTDLDTTFVITAGGVASSCNDVDASGIALTFTPDDGVAQTDIYKCDASISQPIPFGPGTLLVELLYGIDDEVIASSTNELDAMRGALELEVELAVD